MAIPEGLSFDELNKLYEEEHEGNERSMPFDQFFGEMGLSGEQTRKRTETAEDIMAFIMLAFEEMYQEVVDGEYGEYNPTETISENYKTMLTRMRVRLTAMFEAMHADVAAADIVAATMNHADDPYFFSKDRARLIAENESNFIWGDSEFQNAVLTGKTRKRWVAMMDRRTRETHRIANGQVMPISEPFQVGDSLLQFPTDTSLGASADEVVNCRCWCVYY